MTIRSVLAPKMTVKRTNAGNGMPSIMGAPNSHCTLRRVLAARRPVKVLDAAAGQGSLTAFLHHRGWEVDCADIMPELLNVEGLTCRKVDLNRKLPYEDESFDAVVCANAIHRLFNPAGAIREFHRILRPGGRLYLNANNYATVDLRLRFLLYGSIEHREAEQGIDPVGKPEANVRVNWTYPQIANYLLAAGFEIRDVKPAAIHLRHRLLVPVALLVRLASYLVPPGRREREHIRITRSGAVLMGGYYMLIEAAKR